MKSNTCDRREVDDGEDIVETSCWRLRRSWLVVVEKGWLNENRKDAWMANPKTRVDGNIMADWIEYCLITLWLCYSFFMLLSTTAWLEARLEVEGERWWVGSVEGGDGW